MEFKGSLGNYKIITTEDGSQTVYSGFYDENCHSTSGAWEETLYNYVEGTQLLDKLTKQDSVTVFEVGFGVGLGIYATLVAISNRYSEQAQSYNRKIKFISTEIDRDFALWALQDSEFAKKYNISKQDIRATQDQLCVNVQGVELVILIGDARHTIKTLNESILFDCIFQDPFSPRKNPSLWTEQWFRNLRSYSHRDTILSTYSAATRIRKTMAVAGFNIINRLGFGRKRSCTLAVCRDLSDDQEQSFHQSLLNSKAQTLCDHSL